MGFASPSICLIFTLSFIVPLIIGIFCFKKYGKDKFGRILGIVSIIIGIIVGIINAIIVNEYWISYKGYESKMLFIAFMMDLIFVPVLVFGTIKLNAIKDKDREWKPYAILLSVILVAIILITIIGSSLITVTRIGREYEYNIIVTSENNNPYYLYVPAPITYDENISEIVNNFEEISGIVTISIINTTYGFALNLSSTTSFEIKNSGKAERNSFVDVSLRNETERDFFYVYYYSPSNSPIHLEMRGNDDGVMSGIGFWLDVNINQTGWNSVEGFFGHWVV